MEKTHNFTLEVPYELIESGSPGQKPLIVYLHGFKQNITVAREKFIRLFELDAYHLFLQGPYIIYDSKHTRKVTEWGRAWYLYDGNQQQFKASLERVQVLYRTY